MTINTVQVFVDQEGKFGNPVAIVLDEDLRITKDQRQKIAKNVGYSETVFVDNAKQGQVSIFNPQKEVAFAGHALIGTAWFLKNKQNLSVESLTTHNRKVVLPAEGDMTWIQAELDVLPPWNLEKLDSPGDIDNLPDSLTAKFQHTFVWGWIDENNGIVRARTFAPDWGIPEDQANGSGSLLLALKLSRALEIKHGLGSKIYARPVGGNSGEVGGLVSNDVLVQQVEEFLN